MMWHHYCPCEKVDLGNLLGEPCNWCDTPESHPDPTSTPEEFNDYVAKELRTGDKRMNTLTDEITAVKLEQAEYRRLLKENTDDTKAIKADTAELLEAFRSFKGAMKVLEWIGKAAKPLGYIVGVCASVTAFWTALKSGVTQK